MWIEQKSVTDGMFYDRGFRTIREMKEAKASGTFTPITNDDDYVRFYMGVFEEYRHNGITVSIVNCEEGAGNPRNKLRAIHSANDIDFDFGFGLGISKSFALKGLKFVRFAKTLRTKLNKLPDNSPTKRAFGSGYLWISHAATHALTQDELYETGVSTFTKEHYRLDMRFKFRRRVFVVPMFVYKSAVTVMHHPAFALHRKFFDDGDPTVGATFIENDTPTSALVVPTRDGIPADQMLLGEHALDVIHDLGEEWYMDINPTPDFDPEQSASVYIDGITIYFKTPETATIFKTLI